MGISMLWNEGGLEITDRAGVYSGYPRGIDNQPKLIEIDPDNEMLVGFFGSQDDTKITQLGLVLADLNCM